MRVLVTGAEGFIAKNLVVRLRELGDEMDVIPVTRATSAEDLRQHLATSDAIVHLAGVNRPEDPEDFKRGNADFTGFICSTLESLSKATPIVLSSSTQAALDNPYGRSKREAEIAVQDYAKRSGARCYVYRLPNVFGKWCKPNYNSAVATFCHNVARDLPIAINNPAAPLTLVYVDDVVDEIVRVLRELPSSDQACTVSPEYTTTVGELAATIQRFREQRGTLEIDGVGIGFARALYSTYVSYLPTSEFSYAIRTYGDPRGVFAEMLKTRDSGQFSFFTAHPGVTRGGHYHHTKTEKFLVVRGKARFRFRNLLDDECFELHTGGEQPTIVETIPGWSHDITNTGDDEMVVLLWANEVFDRTRPDTIASPVF